MSQAATEERTRNDDRASASAGGEAVADTPAEKKGTQTRTYKVLRVLDASTADSPVSFEMVGDYVAGGDRQAVKQAFEAHGAAKYVAVAESAWHEHAPTVEQVPRVKWS